MANPMEWISSGDTGTSSITLWSVMMGSEPGHPSVPLDSQDFGRCSRLLAAFPEWRKRLGEVGTKYPEWQPLVDNWDELERLYKESFGGRDTRFIVKLRELQKEKVRKPSSNAYLVSLLRNHGAVKRGNFILASGQKSDIYIDIKEALTDPMVLQAVASQILTLCYKNKIPFGIVAGVAVGAVPLVVAVSLREGKPYAIIRKDEKGHGLSDKLIGKMPTDGTIAQRTALLVEDVTTTGGSVREAVRVLRMAGAAVGTVITVVDREQGAKEALKEENVDLISLATMEELTA